jgi:hypothetical protein
MYIKHSELCLPCFARTCKCAQFLLCSICNVPCVCDEHAHSMVIIMTTHAHGIHDTPSTCHDLIRNHDRPCSVHSLSGRRDHMYLLSCRKLQYILRCGQAQIYMHIYMCAPPCARGRACYISDLHACMTCKHVTHAHSCM